MRRGETISFLEPVELAPARGTGELVRGWRDTFADKQSELWEVVRHAGNPPRAHLSEERATYVLGDAIQWFAGLPPNSIHAVVTDPPYGLIEYEDKDHDKLRTGLGGVWRIPPSFDGANRKPLPRFTVLTQEEIAGQYNFFNTLASGLKRALVPGGHIFIASNPLLSTTTFHAFQSAGLEKRGELIRLV